MHRFFIPELNPVVNDVVSLGVIHNQLFRVLRVQPGTQVVVLDNAGNERLMEVEAVERRDTTARVLEVRPAPAEPKIAVTLYQCILKSDKFDLVLQKATELGVTTIVPVVSNRTVSRLGRVVLGKIARWNSIVREAAEQSGRGALPTIAPACDIADALAQATGVRLLPWEEGQANPGLIAALKQTPQRVDAVSLLIGPEGGFDPVEIEAAIVVGWQVVSLGQRILRAETAAMAALTVVNSALGELGDAPLVKAAASKDTPSSASEKTSAQPSEPVHEAKSSEAVGATVTTEAVEEGAKLPAKKRASSSTAKATPKPAPKPSTKSAAKRTTKAKATS